ncbi:MAG: hypothetical protein ACRELY_11360 [Polyangiaceae bacterium]
MALRGAGYFLAGFASGWVVRSTVDSSRDVPVRILSAAFSLTDRVRRMVAMERERLEDLVAEGRARYETKRGRRSQESSADPLHQTPGEDDDDIRGPRPVRKPGERAA